MKPSDRVKGLIGAIAQERLRLTKGHNAVNGIPTLMRESDEKRALQAIQNSPMTWVMAILAVMDTRDAELEGRIADLEHRLDDYLASVQ